jgi:hypothetical protein
MFLHPCDVVLWVDPSCSRIAISPIWLRSGRFHQNDAAPTKPHCSYDSIILLLTAFVGTGIYIFQVTRSASVSAAEPLKEGTALPSRSSVKSKENKPVSSERSVLPVNLLPPPPECIGTGTVKMPLAVMFKFCIIFYF